MDVDDELRRSILILAEQSSENAVVSDLDFAFQLQMQEAIEASSAPQQFHLPENDDVSDSGFDRLLAEEIAMLERELSDREKVEAEMRRTRDELNRRIHDQAFARDVLAIPDEEWVNTGNYFERPFGEGSSTGNSEGFRLYFKGLVSEEIVGDGAKKTFSGVGVAICDVSDSLVFEIRKPLALVDGETSSEFAEVKALIEGLNAALTLGLRRITILCDDNSLYQYVTGQWIPMQSKIATLVDQVVLLQRKFTHCYLSLIAIKDVKFAYKLARDAIVSQVGRPVESGGSKNLIETCTICLEDTDVTQMFSVEGCHHRYCFSCMLKHVEAKLLQGMLPKCPHEGCKSDMDVESCKKFLTPELFDIMTQRIKEASIPATQKFYCPYPRCSALMSKVEVQKYAITSIACAEARTCTACYNIFCISCKVPWHSNMSCYEYKNLNPYPCAEDAKLKSLASRNLWRQCVKCNHMVELAEGCYHIYCRCGFEFCYTCGAEWKNKKPTCACPIWDERNIIRNEHDLQ